MTRLPLRARLTLVVTIVFGVTLAAAAAVGLARIETSLRDNTRNNAEALLIDYLDQLYGGAIGPGNPSPESATRFLYIDEQGNEVTDLEYQELLFEAVIAEAGAVDVFELPEDFPFPGELIDKTPVIVDSGFVKLVIDPVSVSDSPATLDRGSDVIAVGLEVLVGDTPMTIAVSSPVHPVTDSVETLTRFALALVPLLTLTIATATWIIVGRALRPVDAITAQVDQISDHNLDQRVPEPATDDELGHLAATMNNMLTRLQHARDQQRQFISDASHELRSPITATQATLEVARSQPDQTDWPATANILHHENVRLAQLVDDLLLLAQLDEIRAPIGTQQVDLDELCLAEAQRPHPHPIYVHVIDPVRITADIAQFTRAIRNLVDNAAHHANRRVDITISTRHDNAVVEIADDGPGVPPEHLETIFDRFSRLDTSRTRNRGDGAGLGLAIVKQIIHAHNGTITANNQPHGGAQLTIEIPLASNGARPVRN